MFAGRVARQITNPPPGRSVEAGGASALLGESEAKWPSPSRMPGPHPHASQRGYREERKNN